MNRSFVTQSEVETEAAGRALGRSLGAGTIVLLVGELGAGKTAFVRGLAEGLGVPSDDVSSPTFALVQEYRGRIPLHHVDLYRITGAEAGELGLDDLPESGVVAIEWADKLPAPPPDAIEVHIEDLGDDRRRLTVSGAPAGAYSDR